MAAFWLKRETCYELTELLYLKRMSGSVLFAGDGPINISTRGLNTISILVKTVEDHERRTELFHHILRIG